MENLTTKLIAALLVFGALLEIGIMIWPLRRTRRRIKNSLPLLTFYAGIWISFFVWTLFVALDLWRGTPEGYRWSVILFSAQIVKVTIPGFSFEFFTGMRLIWTFGHIEKPLTFQFGVSAEVYLSPQIEDTEIGINFIAIMIVLYLLGVSGRLLWVRSLLS